MVEPIFCRRVTVFMVCTQGQQWSIVTYAIDHFRALYRSVTKPCCPSKTSLVINPLDGMAEKNASRQTSFAVTYRPTNNTTHNFRGAAIQIIYHFTIYHQGFFHSVRMNPSMNCLHRRQSLVDIIGHAGPRWWIRLSLHLVLGLMAPCQVHGHDNNGIHSAVKLNRQLAL